MIVFDQIRHAVKQWRNDENGSVTVETVLMVPILAWVTFAVLTFFDAYRKEAISHKAGLTIADMISREADTISGDFIDGAHDLLRFLTTEENSPDLRVTVYMWEAATGSYKVVWSEERGPREPMTNSDMASRTEKLPEMADLERAILVETWTDYTPPYKIGILNNMSLNTFNVISPRFTTQLCFSNTPTNTATLKC